MVMASNRCVPWSGKLTLMKADVKVSVRRLLSKFVNLNRSYGK